ncbi:MAG: hypothetical protein QOC66_600 [Pseudonocardiales bacterium]|jgi:hypothetical protein|nr:hypothetical protein [Pseudonocardiales bacterium]
MGMLSKAVKIGVLGKLIQVAQREASKPENRKKIADAMEQVKKRAGGASRHGS